MTIPCVFIFFLNIKHHKTDPTKISLRSFEPIFILLWISQNHENTSITKHPLLASLYCSSSSWQSSPAKDPGLRRLPAAFPPTGGELLLWPGSTRSARRRTRRRGCSNSACARGVLQICTACLRVSMTCCTCC